VVLKSMTVYLQQVIQLVVRAHSLTVSSENVPACRCMRTR